MNSSNVIVVVSYTNQPIITATCVVNISIDWHQDGTTSLK